MQQEKPCCIKYYLSKELQASQHDQSNAIVQEIISIGFHGIIS